MKTRNLIFLCLLCIGFGFFGSGLIRTNDEPIMNTDTTIVQWTIEGEINQVHPAPIKIELANPVDPIRTTIFEPVKIPADTAAILADYYTIRKYDSTYVDNDTAFIRLQQKTYMNQIWDLKLNYKFYGTDKIITNTIYPSGLYFVGSMALSTDFVYPTIGMTYVRPKTIYTVNFGYFKSPVLTLGWGWHF